MGKITEQIRFIGCLDDARNAIACALNIVSNSEIFDTTDSDYAKLLEMKKTINNILDKYG